MTALKVVKKILSIGVIGICLIGNAIAGNPPQRSAEDIARDLTSKPIEVIEFSGVKAGDKVLDFLGGSGYYSELLAHQVGAQGSVVLHNNQAYLPYIGKELEQRLAANRLPNVTRLMSEADALNLGEGQFDSIFFVLGYHDLYVVDKNWTVTAEQVIPQLLKALKNNGHLLIIDHSAEKGSGVEQTQKLHRIAADFVAKDLKQRGFSLVKSADLLKNPDDLLNTNVFEPSIRRKTDRFVMLFSKKD